MRRSTDDTNLSRLSIFYLSERHINTLTSIIAIRQNMRVEINLIDRKMATREFIGDVVYIVRHETSSLSTQAIISSRAIRMFIAVLIPIFVLILP